MAGSYHFGRGGGRGRGRGQNMVLLETPHGKPPIKTRIKPDPISGFYKLHVNYIPRNWSELTLKNIFWKVGRPASVYLEKKNDKPFNWAFVEFETFREASDAIKVLNNNVVLDGVEISFARDKIGEDLGLPFFDDENDNGIFDQFNEPIQPTAPIQSSFLPSVPSDLDAPPSTRMFSKTIKNQQVLSTNCIPHHKVVLPVCELEDIKNLENAIFERIQHILKKLSPRFSCEVCGKSSNQSCANCCIHYCSRQCQTQDWQSHSRICMPVNDNNKTSSRANVCGSDAALSQSERTNGYRAAHESEWNFRSPNNRLEEKSSRYEDKQRYNQKQNDNFRQNNRFRNNYDNEKNDRGNFSRDRSRPGNGSEGSKTMFEERKSRFLSNKQMKSEAENEDSWDSNSQQKSNTNYSQNLNTGTTSEPNFNHLSCNSGAASDNQKTEIQGPVAKSTASTVSSPTVKTEIQEPMVKPTTSPVPAPIIKTEIQEPMVKPTTSPVPTPIIKTETLEPVVKATLSQVSMPTTVNNSEQTIAYDLKPGTEEEVLITHIESPRVLHIQKIGDEFCLLHKKLNDSTTAYTPYSPVEHGLCATQYEGEWSRCEVTCLNPLTVLYIDFGNSETSTEDKLFTLPDTLAVKPPFAIKIKLADGTPDEFLNLNANDKLSIKAVIKVEDGWLVQVAGVPYPPPATACSPVPESQIIENGPFPAPTVPTPTVPAANVPAPTVTGATVFPKLIPADVFTKVSVRHKEPTHLAVTPVTSLPELEELSARIQVEAATAAPLTPTVTKCLVHSQTYKHWCRGRVSQVEPLVVKLVDYGSTETCKPEQLRQITTQFSSILPFVVYIKPNHGTVEELNDKSVFSVKPLFKDESGCWVVEVDSSERTEELLAENNSSGTGSSVTQSGMIQCLPDQAGSSTPTASTRELPTQLPSPAQTVTPPQQVRPTLTEFINSDQFTTVVITCKDEKSSEGNTYFVATPTAIKTMVDMCTYFESISKDVLVSPQIGGLGLAPYESAWYRVEVVCLSPLKVFYIDYGNIETIKPEELKICPASHKDVPHLVHKVRLAPGTNEEFYNLPGESEISIKSVSQLADGSTLVQIEGQTYSEPVTPDVTESSQGSETTRLNQNIPDSPVIAQEVQSQEHPVAVELSSFTIDSCPEPQYLVDLLKKDYEVLFVPNKVDPARNLVFGTLLSTKLFPENEILYCEMDNVVDSEPSDPNFNPREGELLVCKAEDWQRAELLELEEKRWLSLVDHGTIIPYDSCKKIPPQYVTAPFMAAVLKLPSPVDMKLLEILQGEDTVDCKVKEVGTGGHVVRVHLKEREFTAEMEKWKYDPLVWPLPLPSGTLVTIIKVLDSNTFLVVPANDDMQMQQTIQIQCHQANFNKLQFHPKIGDHVVTQNNNIFCRARVKQIDVNNSLCTLYNIDLGNEFQASLSSLQPIPPALCKLPTKITPVVLEDVEKITLAKLPELGKLYISTLVEKEKQLRMDICPKLGVVTLISIEDGQLINERLKELFAKTIFPDVSGKYMLDCLAQQEPPMNKELTLTVTLGEPLYVQVVDDDLSKFYLEVHTPLQVHANSDSAPYNPCKNELCIVKFGDEWYRAACGKETNTGISHVFLVDFGNILEVPTSDIRKINADFLSYPSVGLLCKIKGVPDEINTQLRARLNEILTVESNHLGIFESKKDDTYYVNLPSVLTLLKMENLVSQ